MILNIELGKVFNDLLGAGIVIAVLIAAAVIIRLLVSAFKKTEVPSENEETPVSAPVQSIPELKLVDVDDKTAAIVMAIVSHESGIPLPELIFKSIKLV